MIVANGGQGSISLTTHENSEQQKCQLNNKVLGFVVIICNSVIGDGDVVVVVAAAVVYM